MKIEVQCLRDNDGVAYYAKGHVPLDEFMNAVKAEENEGSPILDCQPEHCWLRVCRDFQEEMPIFVEAAPGSKGAFRATWIQE